jgi:hypothetical protein
MRALIEHFTARRVFGLLYDFVDDEENVDKKLYLVLFFSPIASTTRVTIPAGRTT